ncbi:TonB-dependent receptor [Alteromonas sp. ASW11-19]|uniref:TonB-dependent receptor n=2 Tax=Alteromonas salexigens TaxID=2982530 RepID=A0ABT2VL76_9ALTE|nr:TonB-dependent receptor [Alteromonas salexigens]MCU7553016.1 TonB-dependent receptor [Alteromonas salexigens]
MANENVERIVVTGSRVVESIDEVPASVTIISAEEIQEHLRVTPELQSLLAIYVPGMGPDTGSSSNTGQTLRGRAPLIMIDGVPQSTPLRNGSLGVKTLDPSAIERIEVIKGATSIFGNGAAGGIVNYITRSSQTEDGISGEVAVSSRFSAVRADESAGVRVEAAVTGRSNRWQYLFTSSVEENGVQRDAQGDILGLQYGLSDTVSQNYFAKVGFDIDNDKTFQVAYNYYRSQQKTDLGDVNDGHKDLAIHVASPLQKQGEPQGPDGNTNLMVTYEDSDIFTNTELVVDYYQQNIENVFFYSPSLANPAEGYDGGQSVIKSQKKGLRATFSSQLDYSGVEATFIYGIDALNDVTSQPLVDGRVWVPEMDMQNLAGFLQSKWLFADDFILKAGIRNEHITLGVDDYTTLRLCRQADQCSVSVAVDGGEIDYQATTYNLALKYQLNDAFHPFISYSQGADISDTGRLLRTATVTDITNIRTEASVIDNYEAGFTSQLGADLRVEFSAYFSTSELGTSTRFDAETGVYLPVRAPQEIWGYEGLVNYHFSSSIDVTATYSYVEGKDTQEDVYLGGRTINPPKATVIANWRPDDRTRLAVEYLFVGDRDRFEPDTEGNYSTDQAPVHSYHVVNLNGHYTFADNLRGFFGVQNLLNEDYFPARAQAYTYGGYRVKGLGTTVNLGMEYSF